MIIRPFEKSDVDGMLDWMHDPNVNRFFRFNAAAATKESVIQFINEAEKAASNNTDYHFAIAKDDGEYIGTVSLKHIDKTKNDAEYAIAIRSAFHHQGAGQFATKAILAFAFEKLNLESVYLNVLSDNTNAKALYEKIGFVWYEHEKDAFETNGIKKDLDWYRITKNNFRG
jgi:diamine N-acetyltransferase